MAALAFYFSLSPSRTGKFGKTNKKAKKEKHSKAIEQFDEIMFENMKLFKLKYCCTHHDFKGQV